MAGMVSSHRSASSGFQLLDSLAKGACIALILLGRGSTGFQTVPDLSICNSAEVLQQPSYIVGGDIVSDVFAFFPPVSPFDPVVFHGFDKVRSLFRESFTIPLFPLK